LNLCDLTVHEAHDLLVQKQITSLELTRAVLERVAAVESKIQAFVTLTPELALQQAAAADRRLAAGEAAPLTGIHMALKDVLCTQGVQTTCSSRILQGFVPPYDATAVSRLRAAGAVLVGKTNMDEFAMGSSNENSAFFPTHNPWELGRVPGGSSGGSAAAVAAGEAFFALGSDTGGSVRLPAAFCGLVGLKPTYGRVSRYGLVAFASSLDQIGPFGRDVRDCALVTQAIAGYDPRDSTSVNTPVPDYVGGLGEGRGLAGLRLGVPREYFVAGMQPGVEAAVRAAIAKLVELGATVTEVSLSHTAYALPTYYLIAPAEASANLARYDGVKYGLGLPESALWEAYRETRGQGFGPEVKRRIMLGTYALSAGYYDAYYLKAQKVRTLIKQDFDRAFQQCDVIAAPTSPTVAFKLGEKVDDPLTMYLSDVCTLSVNLAGLPGLVVPCGLVAGTGERVSAPGDSGLPVGLQLIGQAFAEAKLFQVAYAYEQATPHLRFPHVRPPL
jgi:aspartyl-tRNA(Asn)/glutamyl-tRNA(Gln) amidotransferase subunit A